MARKYVPRTHCPNGHLYTEQNTQTINSAKGTYRRCKTCAETRRLASTSWLRDYQLERRYGITRAERSKILVSQDGLCAICYERPAVTVDHDHETGKVRGMLCRACNVALGVLGDDVDSIRRVLEYMTASPPLEEVI